MMRPAAIKVRIRQQMIPLLLVLGACGSPLSVQESADEGACGDSSSALASWDEATRHDHDGHHHDVQDANFDPIAPFDFSPQQLIYVQALPMEGFNFPYFLFIPQKTPKDRPIRLLVAPNNSGRADDDFQFHLRRAKDQLRRGSPGRYLAEELGVPLLVPAFPRPRGIWLWQQRIYTHALDRDAMLIEEGPLERIDLQLVAMIDHARAMLMERDLQVQDRILMDGFSASGTFVNRFAALHPQLVRAVAAGAVNGLPIFPLAELDGTELPYPIGVADIEQLTGTPFDQTAYESVSQYIYMGYLDRNDTYPYDDAWNDTERDLIARLFGEEMMPTRWQRSQALLAEWAPSAQLVTYDGTAHRIRPEMLADIVAFFRANEGDQHVTIDHHRFPFVEYREITEAHIVGVLWLSDERIPERVREDVGEWADEGVLFAVLINEWIEWRDYRQLEDFYHRAGGLHFVLRADGYEDIQVTPPNYRGTRSSGDGTLQAFVINLVPSQMAKMAPGVPYMLHSINKSTEYFWTVCPGVSLVKPE